MGGRLGYNENEVIVDGMANSGNKDAKDPDASGNIGKASGKHQENIGRTSGKHQESRVKEFNRSQKEIIAILSENGHITIPEMAEKIGISIRNVEANIRGLREAGVLIRRGSRKEGYWEIILQK